MFYIYGQVQRPGQVRLERGMTVMQALAAGGGVTGKGLAGASCVTDATRTEKLKKRVLQWMMMCMTRMLFTFKESLF